MPKVWPERMSYSFLGTIDALPCWMQLPITSTSGPRISSPLSAATLQGCGGATAGLTPAGRQLDDSTAALTPAAARPDLIAPPVAVNGIVVVALAPLAVRTRSVAVPATAPVNVAAITGECALHAT